jgi:hypothetical protein
VFFSNPLDTRLLFSKYPTRQGLCKKTFYVTPGMKGKSGKKKDATIMLYKS